MVKGSSTQPPLAYEPNRMIFRNTSALLELRCPVLQSVLEFLVQDLDGPGDLSLLFRRDVIEGRFHRRRHFNP